MNERVGIGQECFKHGNARDASTIQLRAGRVFLISGDKERVHGCFLLKTTRELESNLGMLANKASMRRLFYSYCSSDFLSQSVGCTRQFNPHNLSFYLFKAMIIPVTPARCPANDLCRPAQQFLLLLSLLDTRLHVTKPATGCGLQGWLASLRHSSPPTVPLSPKTHRHLRELSFNHL